MSNLAIRVEGLGKCYRVQQGENKRGTYNTLRESLTKFVTSPFRKRQAYNDFWALRDISFEVKPSDLVGIIGTNGAGKSTLLKLLSRITKPTEGEIEIRGRVGSLLEVGTGFHPELSGRENVYLNGSILGMKRREIAKKFDDIVSFAEVESFLDTPVKRYSSGMYVRLAFAVAAYLEPEIMIVDEVLAVGDTVFQKRCIDRMAQLGRSGVTIFFVSHNMELVPRLCQTAILLKKGRIARTGAANAVVNDYLGEISEGTQGVDLTEKSRIGTGEARFTKIELFDANRQATHSIRSGEKHTFRLTIDSNASLREVDVCVIFKNAYGTRLTTAWNREVGRAFELKKGSQVISCEFEKLDFRPGQQLQVMLWMAAGDVLDAIDPAARYLVVDTPETEERSHDPSHGVILLDYAWRMSEEG